MAEQAQEQESAGADVLPLEQPEAKKTVPVVLFGQRFRLTLGEAVAMRTAFDRGIEAATIASTLQEIPEDGPAPPPLTHDELAQRLTSAGRKVKRVGLHIRSVSMVVYDACDCGTNSESPSREIVDVARLRGKELPPVECRVCGTILLAATSSLVKVVR